MNVLLFSMPDSFEHTPSLTMRLPNGALSSLAGNIDAHHRVAIADLVLAQHDVLGTVTRLVREHQPDVIGLSIMTFQRKTALGLLPVLRQLRPDATIVIGGYDPSLAPEAYDAAPAVDLIVRGEGDITFRELLRALEGDRDLSGIAGLSIRRGPSFIHHPDRPISDLGDDVKMPNRGARVLDGYTFLGRKIDVVETSRGCTYDCSFCSIVEMRGRNFHTWSVERTIADITDARDRGAGVIFLVDDNITLNIARFTRLCEAITAAGLNTIDFIVQGMTSAVVSGGESMARAMKAANFRYVFLGIENILDADLTFLNAAAKNAERRGGRSVGCASQHAIELLHRHGMYVVGGLIVGSPGDTTASIEANLAFARQFVDWPYIQHPTPYPGTPMSKDFRAKGLITSDDVSEYDGTTAVVRTESLTSEEVEYLRWKAERWMKVRHLPVVLRHDLAYVLRNGWKMTQHTFRGMRLRTWLGLESERQAFRRYKAIRRRERQYLPQMAEPAPALPTVAFSDTFLA